MIQILLLGCIIMLSISNASATWLDGNYDFRQPVILTGNTSEAQTYYQLLLNVSYDSDMQTDFDDLRFYNETSEIDAWLESKIDSSYALVWVEFPTTPANTVEQTYYMYYGNSSTANNWDGSTTFNFFDDFSGDLSKWSVSGTPTIAVEKVELNDDDWIVSTIKFGYGYAYESFSEADEQDINLIAAYPSTAGNTNRIAFQQSDSDDPDDFDDYILITDEGGAQTTHPVQNWDDFRNTLRRYSIYRPAADDVTFVQGGHSAQYTTGNIPTANLGLSFRVWDSSQESTLKIDWGLVRKYAPNPASYEFGSEEQPPHIPPTPTNLESEIIDMDIKHTWSAGPGNITDSYNVSVNDVWHNSTTNTYYQETYDYNEWQNITVWAYNNTGCLSLSSVSNNAQMPGAPTYIPPTPTNLQSEIINKIIKHTWNAGTGNITDSYNVSVNDVWHNSTTNTYWQAEYAFNEWQNITIWAYNTTGHLSSSSVSNDTQITRPPYEASPEGEGVGYKLKDNEIKSFFVPMIYLIFIAIILGGFIKEIK